MIDTEQQPEGDAVLTVDKQGRIANCNQVAKTLLGWEGAVLEGHPVTDVIPELPFSPNTPGYNLAFAIFHAGNGAWMRRIALMVDGKRIAVDTALSSVKIGYKRQIKLCLRLASPLLQVPAKLAATVQAPLLLARPCGA